MHHQPSLCYAIVLVILSVVSSSLLMNADIFPSPMANLSTSWTNNPSNPVFNNSTMLSNFTMSPILYRGFNESQFLCGFYCDSNETAACLFGVLIFQTGFHDEGSTLINEPRLVWSANRDHPVKFKAILNFTNSGDMILKDTDDALIWSTNTRGKNVVGLNLTEKGNLILHDKNNKIVWQSFDHPTDTLLPEQMLVRKQEQKLTSSISITNSSRGLFSLGFQGKSFSAYIESSPPQNYFDFSYLALEENQYINVENGIFEYRKPLSSTPQFMRLESDGHLKVYVWQESGWNEAADLLASYIGECGYPLACGKYGICSDGQCSCPDVANNQTSTFRPIIDWQPNHGCTSVMPISCSHPEFHTLLELKNMSYLNSDTRFGLSVTESNGEMTLEDCKNSCLRNCSCKAALFVHDMYDFEPQNGASSYNGCRLLNEVFSLMNTEGYDNIIIFLKVEKSSITQNSTSSLFTRNSTSSLQKKSRRVLIIVGSSIGVFFGAIFLFGFLFLLFRRNNKFEESDDFSFDQVPWMPTRFSYEDLKAVTSNFINKLGEGGFGSVFEGTLDDGTKVAVKRLDGLGHIKKSFLAEVKTIGSIHHVNLVRLIGFCSEKSLRLLVYEYMSNGSLDKWIFQKHHQDLILGWQQRRNIITDIAKGLAYLHEDCRCKILHLDIKPQNILLDENLNAKVSDFGLAKLIDKDQSRVVTNLRGTPGYLAPEWLSSIITEKVDVYSFGVVVLEILCGRKNLDQSQPEEDMHLITVFKRKAEEERLEDIIDTCNEDMQLHVAEIVKMMKVSAWCLQSDFSLRPSMSMVVKAIEDSTDVGNYFTNLALPRNRAPVVRQEDAINGDATLLSPIPLSEPR